MKNLAQSPNTILFEGLHSCYLLDNPKLLGNKKIVRLHNVEWEYYQHLSLNEQSWWKKLYFKRESKLLKQFEKKLSHADLLLPISHKDYNYYHQLFPDKTQYLPVFHPHNQIVSLKGKGDYILYHGNLEVNENTKAVHFLLDKVQALCAQFKWIVAGKNPSENLQKKCQEQGVKLIANPTHEQMQSLIQNAHINVLPTFQDTGIKLKLLNALFAGRHCLVNSKMVAQTNLESLCTIVEQPQAFVKVIEQLMEQPIKEIDLNKRQNILEQEYSNHKNAAQLLGWINDLESSQ